MAALLIFLVLAPWGVGGIMWRGVPVEGAAEDNKIERLFGFAAINTVFNFIGWSEGETSPLCI